MEEYRIQVSGKEYIFMDRDEDIDFDMNFP